MIVRFILDMEGEYTLGDVVMMRQIIHGTMQAAPGRLRGLDDHRHDGPFTEEAPCDSCQVASESVIGEEFE
jgi:hypothetical protein